MHNALRWNKKGFLFTTLAILFIIAIVMLAATKQAQFPRTMSQTMRIELMNTYLDNLETDLSRAAYIAGFRSFIGLEERISQTGNYTVDFDSDFRSIFTNGTNGNTTFAIMEDSTFEDFAGRFEALSSQQGFVVTLFVSSVTAYQRSPWFVTLNVSVDIFMSDTAGTAVFNYTAVIITDIPVEGIKDPLHTVNLNGRLPRTFRQNTYDQPYITAGDDTTKLQQILNQSLYTASLDAPSVLQRFSGNLSSSPYGIQSLMSIKDLRAQEIPIDTCKSIIDYLYFGDEDTDNNKLIVNMDENEFWLDEEHLGDYDASGKTTGDKPCS